jgi:TonB-linked SusC/RagA family outer membrane protein
MDKKLLLVVLLAVFALPLSLFAQTGSLTGQITSAATGEELPGATVIVEQLTRGASTDLNGEYQLVLLPAGTYTVRYSFVGYRSLRRTVTIGDGEVVLNVQLEEDIFGLDDVIVSGYAVTTKRELTGAISQVRARDVEGLDIKSPDQALQGRAAGARVTNLSGQPGGGVHIRIRGLGSINASNDPLYIVDGVPITDVDRGGIFGNAAANNATSNALNAINPRDIESIEVLKDAAAAAIYGAQAANGVILITTKRGVRGRTTFNVSSSIGLVDEIKRHDIIEGPEWARLQYESFEWWGEFTNNPNWRTIAANNLGGITYEQAQAGDVPHYDWQDALMRQGVNRKVDISARGGTDQTRFYIAGGYNFEEGAALGTDFERFNLRSNIDHQASDRVQLELNLNVSNTVQNGALQAGFFSGSPFFAGQFQRPTDAIYRCIDGSTYDGQCPRTYNNSLATGFNPLAANELDDRRITQKQLVANTAVIVNLSRGLTFRSYYGIDYRMTDDKDYRAPESPAGSGLGGYLFEANRQVTNMITNQVFNYFDTFGDVHNVSGLAGFEYRQEVRTTKTAGGQGFPSGLFRTLQNAAEPFSVGGFGSEFRIAGFFGRVQYDYDRRYLLNASVRRDGSSRFGIDNRWGTFYSGSVAWVLSQESFMDFSNDWLEELKLRTSYGITGNTGGISDFASRQLFGSGGAYINQPALTATSLGNNILTWEESATANIGLDWVLYAGRVYGSFDIFQRNTSRLLLDRELPNDSGFTSITENAGKVRNEGIEIELGAVLLDVGGFVWTSEFNVTFQRNELRELNKDPEGNPVTRIGTDYWVGQPLTIFYMRRYAGVNPADGRPMFYDFQNNITYVATFTADEFDDRRFVGDSAPSSYGGWSNRMTFRGIALDVLFQYNFGQKTYDAFRGSFTDGAYFRRLGLVANSRNRWTEPGQITSVERAYVNSAYPGRGSGFAESTRFLEDASYIRLKNVRLSYTLPTDIVNIVGLRRARVFTQGTNLITWTNYNGIDPELVGRNNAVYPQSRTITTGIEIEF